MSQPKNTAISNDQQNPKAHKSADGSLYFDIDDKKRISVRKFKGKVLIDIREFYEKDGELQPGKKGISLSLENWEKLSSLISSVDELLVNSI